MMKKLFKRSNELTLKFISEELMIRVKIVRYLTYVLFFPIVFVTLLFMILRGKEDRIL